MSIIAVFPHKGASLEVEVLDVFESGGVNLAAVRALDGRPFIGGDKWPVRTEYATVEAGKLLGPGSDSRSDPKPFSLWALAQLQIGAEV